MRNRICRVVGLIMGVAIIAGCASIDYYKPPTGKPSELARIKNGDKRVGVMSIDDKRAMTMGQFVFNNYPELIVVAPGKHRILAIVGGYQNVPQMWLWLVAEAGKDYILKQEVAGSHIRFWLEDGASGKPIGGIVGSDDEPEDKPPAPAK